MFINLFKWLYVILVSGFSSSSFWREIIMPQSIAKQSNLQPVFASHVWSNVPHRRTTWGEGVTQWWGSKHRDTAFKIKSHGKRCFQAAESTGNHRPVILGRLKMRFEHIDSHVVTLLSCGRQPTWKDFCKMEMGFPKLNFNLKETKHQWRD